MQSTNSKYGTPYLATCHILFPFIFIFNSIVLKYVELRSCSVIFFLNNLVGSWKCELQWDSVISLWIIGEPLNYAFFLSHLNLRFRWDWRRTEIVQLQKGKRSAVQPCTSCDKLSTKQKAINLTSRTINSPLRPAINLRKNPLEKQIMWSVRAVITWALRICKRG